MAYLVFDLETITDKLVGWEPKDEDDKFGPPISQQIVCFGTMWVSGGEIRVPEVWPGEKESVAKFTRMVAHKNVTLVGWNSRGFDVPVIMARAMRHGIPMPSYFEKRFGTRYRYSEEGHIDLMDQLADYGASRRSKLVYAAALIGMPVKVEGDGSKVAELWVNGEIEKLERYCLSDVVATGAVLVRWLLLRGVWNRPTHDRAMNAIIDLVYTDERFELLRKGLDPRRLLLEEQK